MRPASTFFISQLSNSGARTPDASTGSGLGLTIVKTIIDRNNGKI